MVTETKLHGIGWGLGRRDALTRTGYQKRAPITKAAGTTAAGIKAE